MNLFLPVGQSLVFNNTLGNCEQGIISTDLDVQARFDLGAALADEDVSGENGLTSKFFYTQPLCIAVATVSAGTTTFFMCHFLYSTLIDSINKRV